VTDDISDIRPGMRAEIYLTAYKQRITPMVHGDIIQLSADRLTDSRTGTPYYAALVRSRPSIPLSGRDDRKRAVPGIFKHSLTRPGISRCRSAIQVCFRIATYRGPLAFHRHKYSIDGPTSRVDCGYWEYVI